MNLNELKAKAQAATPGVWRVVSQVEKYEVGEAELFGVDPVATIGWFRSDGYDSLYALESMEEADAAFIAAANPQTVLALVKVAEAVKKVLESDNQEFYPDSPFDRAVEYAYAALEELEAME